MSLRLRAKWGTMSPRQQKGTLLGGAVIFAALLTGVFYYLSLPTAPAKPSPVFTKSAPVTPPPIVVDARSEMAKQRDLARESAREEAQASKPSPTATEPTPLRPSTPPPPASAFKSSPAVGPLAAQVKRLNGRVNQLNNRLAAIESGRREEAPPNSNVEKEVSRRSPSDREAEDRFVEALTKPRSPN